MLITAGPTREYFDTVRFISNPSSGRMGYALAEAARRRGHEVVLVSGPVSLAAPKGVRCVSVVSAVQMAAACKKLWPACDVGIMTAAVCDYRPKVRLDHKLRKRSAARHITLEPTEDIATTLGESKANRVLIGFAMEDHDHRRHAEIKLRRKRCDAIVLNGPQNVGGQRATVQILVAGGTWSGPISGSKRRIAGRIVRLAEQLTASARRKKKRGSARRGGTGLGRGAPKPRP